MYLRYFRRKGHGGGQTYPKQAEEDEGPTVEQDKRNKKETVESVVKQNKRQNKCTRSYLYYSENVHWPPCKDNLL